MGELAGEILPGVSALADLDLAFARGKYADNLHAAEPILLSTAPKRQRTKPEAEEKPQPAAIPTLKLLDARHPLIDPAKAVPVTIDPIPGTFSIVITGPNTGGKTVTLKTVGLLAVMAQSGLHIPATSGSELPCFREIFADIGDEQSIEQSLSTFSGHITNIIHILKNADQRSLVILDELGAGTDPQEGAALARAILSHLLGQGITTFVATHYPELKTFAHTTPGVVNASLEFNIQTLQPTYKLTLGLPGRSNALAIAQRLGLPGKIIDAARAEVNPDDLRADKLIGDIHRQRKIAFKESEKAERARSEARRLERELTARLDAIEQERQQILDAARAEGELEVEVLKAQLNSLKAELKKAHQPLDAIQSVEQEVELVEEKIRAPQKKRGGKVERPSSIARRPLSIGEKVILRTLGTEGVVTAVDEQEAEIQAGLLRLRVPLEELKRKSDSLEEDLPFQAKKALPINNPQLTIKNPPSTCPPPRAWKLTCAGSPPRRRWISWIPIWIKPGWRACRSCASSTARAPASCARWYGKPCEGIRK